jgi:nitrile hydratase
MAVVSYSGRLAPDRELPMTSFDSDRIADIHRQLHTHLPSDPALRIKALESVLVQKGLLDSRAVDAWVEAFTEEIGPKRGAHVVAKAWLDRDYKTRLLADAPAAIKELGYLGRATFHLKVVENSEQVHNLVVCSLCSCYPVSIFGIAPNWYKTAAYRACAVRDPRGVLAEFGVEIGADVEVRVWDSTAELRYMVLPQKPAGTETWDEARLARLVTRNAMIGTDRDLVRKVADTA